MLQVWNDEDQDDEVLAMVVRTGCNSTIGNMLRRAMRPSHFLSATDSLIKARCAASSYTKTYTSLINAFRLCRIVLSVEFVVCACMLGGVAHL